MGRLEEGAAMPNPQEQFMKYSATDPVPDAVPAGVGTVQAGDQSVFSCLQPAPNPVVTKPEHVKFSDTLKYDPGHIQVHPGLYGQKLLPRQVPYGRENPCKADSSTVHEILNPAPISKLMEQMNEEKEKLYHSKQKEPLGGHYNHGLYVPEYAKHPDYRFGAASDRNQWGAKELVCPPPSDIDDTGGEVHRRYVISHGSFNVAEQRNRNYDWPSTGKDPKTFKFGFSEAEPLRDGVKKAISGPEADAERTVGATVVQKTVTDFKDFNHDLLGKCKRTGAGLHNLSKDFTFGTSTMKDPGQWGTKECIEGNASLEEQMPDPDLGKTLQPGWRNITNETRAFGVPNVRTDVPLPRIRSVADNQNYGDEADAKELLYPNGAAWKGVQPDDFYQPRSLDEIMSVMECAGFDLTAAQAEQVYAEAKNAHPEGLVSLESFRHTMLDMDQAFTIKG